jgi:hypothetical protein
VPIVQCRACGKRLESDLRTIDGVPIAPDHMRPGTYEWCDGSTINTSAAPPPPRRPPRDDDDPRDRPPKASRSDHETIREAARRIDAVMRERAERSDRAFEEEIERRRNAGGDLSTPEASGEGFGSARR